MNRLRYLLPHNHERHFTCDGGHWGTRLTRPCATAYWASNFVGPTLGNRPGPRSLILHWNGDSWQYWSGP